LDRADFRKKFATRNANRTASVPSASLFRDIYSHFEPDRTATLRRETGFNKGGRFTQSIGLPIENRFAENPFTYQQLISG
jgi:hypothetical protein